MCRGVSWGGGLCGSWPLGSLKGAWKKGRERKSEVNRKRKKGKKERKKERRGDKKEKRSKDKGKDKKRKAG